MDVEHSASEFSSLSGNTSRETSLHRPPTPRPSTTRFPKSVAPSPFLEKIKQYRSPSSHAENQMNSSKYPSALDLVFQQPPIALNSSLTNLVSAPSVSPWLPNPSPIVARVSSPLVAFPPFEQPVEDIPESSPATNDTPRLNSPPVINDDQLTLQDLDLLSSCVVPCASSTDSRISSSSFVMQSLTSNEMPTMISDEAKSLSVSDVVSSMDSYGPDSSALSLSSDFSCGDLGPSADYFSSSSPPTEQSAALFSASPSPSSSQTSHNQFSLSSDPLDDLLDDKPAFFNCAPKPALDTDTTNALFEFHAQTSSLPPSSPIISSPPSSQDHNLLNFKYPTFSSPSHSYLNAFACPESLRMSAGSKERNSITGDALAKRSSSAEATAAGLELSLNDEDSASSASILNLSSPSPGTAGNATMYFPNALDSSIGFPASAREAQGEQPMSELHLSAPDIEISRSSDNCEPSRDKTSHHAIEAPAHQYPNPNRPALASQRQQYKKLAAPFRSPLLPSSVEDPLGGCLKAVAPTHKLEDCSLVRPVPELHAPLTIQSPPEVQLSHRTQRVAKQFKSPLAPSDTNSGSSSNLRLTPAIQTLERKLQLLRRAVNIKENREDKNLKDLAVKWRNAGREIAWEVWELVKDNTSTFEASRESKRKFQQSWDWSQQEDEKRSKLDIWDWGGKGNENDDGDIFWRHTEDDGEVEQPRNTLGTMLRQLNIAPETLGWNDEEEMFVD